MAARTQVRAVFSSAEGELLFDSEFGDALPEGRPCHAEEPGAVDLLSFPLDEGIEIVASFCAKISTAGRHCVSSFGQADQNSASVTRNSCDIVERAKASIGLQNGRILADPASINPTGIASALGMEIVAKAHAGYQFG